MYAALASMKDKNDGEEESEKIEKSHFKWYTTQIVIIEAI